MNATGEEVEWWKITKSDVGRVIRQEWDDDSALLHILHVSEFDIDEFYETKLEIDSDLKIVTVQTENGIENVIVNSAKKEGEGWTMDAYEYTWEI